MGPDSIPMTHETWQISKASIIGIEIRFKTFIKQKTKYEGFLKKFEYINEYGSPYRTQISKYGMATRTRLCTQISEKLAQYRWDIR